MKFPSREIVERVRREYPTGTRVELIRMDDPQAPPTGTRGTVTGVDDTASWFYVKKKYKLNMPFLVLSYPAKASALLSNAA